MSGPTNEVLGLIREHVQESALVRAKGIEALAEALVSVVGHRVAVRDWCLVEQVSADGRTRRWWYARRDEGEL